MENTVGVVGVCIGDVKYLRSVRRNKKLQKANKCTATPTTFGCESVGYYCFVSTIICCGGE